MYFGVGDTLFQRHYIKKLYEMQPDVLVKTAFPQFFWDLPNLQYWWEPVPLRVQEENMLKLHHLYSNANMHMKPDCHIGYGDRNVPGTIVDQFQEKINRRLRVNITDYSLELPLKDEWLEKATKIINGRKVCLVRPPTTRREWMRENRNPEPGLMQLLIDKAAKDHDIISVSYNAPREEWYTEDLKIGERYDHGEIPIEVVAAMYKLADMCVIPVGYALPMSLAVKAKTFCVMGSWDSPKYLLDPRMDQSRLRYIEPETPIVIPYSEEPHDRHINPDRLMAEFDKFVKEVV